MFKIKRKKRWQFVLTIENVAIGWKKFAIGFIKIQTMPAQGEALRPSNYKGVLFSFNFWLPFSDFRID